MSREGHGMGRSRRPHSEPGGPNAIAQGRRRRRQKLAGRTGPRLCKGCAGFETEATDQYFNIAAFLRLVGQGDTFTR